MSSERHGVAAKVIATVDDLDRIAGDDEADAPALKGWRRELFGARALDLKHSRLALAIERGRVVAVERDSFPKGLTKRPPPWSGRIPVTCRRPPLESGTS